ncbi:hypothetical protein LUZ60_000138 [Juncus effusus]|nr:hypothetical protein LUZ60_000138 [Juncus effusus]
MAMANNPPHILLIPFPAQGHMLPFLDFTHLLSLHNFSLTILTTPLNLPLLSPLLSKSPSIQTLSLPFPLSPHIPAGVENSKNQPPSFFAVFVHALNGLYAPLLTWIKAQSDTNNPIRAIISDFFLGWTQPLAKEIGIPRIAFSPSAVLGTAVLHSLLRRLPKKLDLSDDNYPISFPEIPGLPIYPWYQMTLLYRTYKDDDPISVSVRQNFIWNLESWGFVSNTFKALEEKYLAQPLEDFGFKRIYAVGPLKPIDDAIDRGGVTSLPAGEVMTWLGKWREGSVVYVSFGSQAILPPSQASLLANALEKSGVCFVWAMRENTVLPQGFEERNKEKGMIIKGWAPQVAILNHESIGWFLTHCGWNSVLESITARKPLIAWPMTADQYVNARFLIEEAGTAIVAWDKYKQSEDELASNLEELIEERGRKVRDKAKEMGRLADEAVREGGSSFLVFEEFVEELCKM